MTEGMTMSELRDAAQQALDALDHGGPAHRLGAMHALRSALSQQEAQPVAWMAMRWGVPAQATTDEPTAIRWRKAGGDVRSLVYADAPPPAPVAQPYASEIAKIIRHARAGNMDGVRSYALLLCDKMDAAAPESANYLRRVVKGDDGELVHLAAPVAQPAAQQTQGEAVVNDKTEREIAQLIDERDAYHLWADKLADAIAKLTSTEIGEHTSGNLPWFNALQAADVVLGGLETVADAETTDAVHKAMQRFTATLTAQQTQGEAVAWLYDFPNPGNPADVIRSWFTQDRAEIERCGGFNIRALTELPAAQKMAVPLTLTDEQLAAGLDAAENPQLSFGDIRRIVTAVMAPGIGKESGVPGVESDGGETER